MARTPTEAFVLNVRQYRLARGWSQQKMADAMTKRGAPTTRESLAKLETGHRQDVTIAELCAVADVLSVSPASLMQADPSLTL